MDDLEIRDALCGFCRRTVRRADAVAFGITGTVVFVICIDCWRQAEARMLGIYERGPEIATGDRWWNGTKSKAGGAWVPPGT